MKTRRRNRLRKWSGEWMYSTIKTELGFPSKEKEYTIVEVVSTICSGAKLQIPILLSIIFLKKKVQL
jgi:hypothetical protein